VRGVCGVVLDPDLAEAEPLGQPVGLDQRRHAGLERVARALALGERQEVRIAPDPARSRLDLALQLHGVEAGVVISDLERPEAALAEEGGAELIGRSALLAVQ